MKKWLVFLSLIMNMVLLYLYVAEHKVNEAFTARIAHVEALRGQNLKVLEKLLEGRISRKETLDILTTHFNKKYDLYENTVAKMLGTDMVFEGMSIIFDSNGRLKAIEADNPDFEK